MESPYSANLDTFAADHLPAPELQPLIQLGDLDYPARLNAAVELLAAGAPDAPCLRGGDRVWSYADLRDESARIARVLVEDLGVVPGNRVLQRGANTPEQVAVWFAVLRAGGVAVATMPMLRSAELRTIIERAQISHALCEAALTEELEAVGPSTLRHRATFGAGGELDAMAADKAPEFDSVQTAAEDVALIAFTSGTTGQPKGCVHLHRDVLAVCDTYAAQIVRPVPSDVFTGTPPIAFTFGLGALVLFPLRFGASTALIAVPSPDALVATIESHGVTVVSTAPTMYRALMRRDDLHRLGTLRLCVSAGEPLPAPTSDAWFERTGLRIADGIGATEMLHIFISAAGEEIRPGSTGRPVPGYTAIVVDDEFNALGPEEVGRLAVRGPTGCRYLDDPRQTDYVQQGWNVTGDAYRIDADGYFWFEARTDDLIISSGYNISGLEVEAVLLSHPHVLECAVVASPDELRGHIVKAFVVLDEGAEVSVTELQDFVKDRLAPYKYPRAVEFLTELPKTQTGKVQRFKLRELESARVSGTA